MKGFLTAAERLGSFEEIRRNLAEGVTPMLATGLSQILVDLGKAGCQHGVHTLCQVPADLLT